jgi:adenine-specific DNA-methyltransferase
MNKFFNALPAYFGGKRKLVKAIFSVTPGASDAPVFADAFLGGGSVSLYAKALGYRVLCNDLADRSVLIGKALIENSKEHINFLDICRLTQHEPGAIDALNGQWASVGFVRENFVPEVFTEKHADFLDQALAYIGTIPQDAGKHWLYKLLLVKFILALRPLSKFSSPNAFNRPFAEGRIEFIKQRTYGRTIQMAMMPITDLLWHTAHLLNEGIIDNGQANEAHQGDVKDFLDHIQADVVYFDPPYAGTSSYEDIYRTLDEILIGKKIERQQSEFSAEDGQKLLGEVFEHAQHIPTWILSMGNAGGKHDCLGDLVSMMSKYRTVEAHEIKYKHMVSMASEEHRSKNREYLLVGRPKGARA